MEKEKKTLEYYLVVVLFSILIGVCFLQVLFRFVLNLPLAWTEELSRYIFIILIYCGASAAAKDNQHVRVELIDSLLPAKVKGIFDVVIRVICAGICVVISLNTFNMIKNAQTSNQLSASLQIPMAIIYSLVAVMFLLIAFRFLQVAWKISKNKEDNKTA